MRSTSDELLTAEAFSFVTSYNTRKEAVAALDAKLMDEGQQQFLARYNDKDSDVIFNFGGDSSADRRGKGKLGFLLDLYEIDEELSVHHYDRISLVKDDGHNLRKSPLAEAAKQ